VEREREISRKQKSAARLRSPARINGPAVPKGSAERELVRRIFAWTIDGEVLDERLTRYQGQGAIGFAWLMDSWVAALAGAVAALEDPDWCFAGAREARVAVWRGMPPSSYLAQLLGREGPGGAGRTLPGMLSDSDHRVASVSGGPGAHLPQAVGAALAARHLGRRECALALAGAGAVDSPDFHVACNFAAVFKVPGIFLIRGGADWAPGAIAARAGAYGLPGERLDGSDPLHVSVRVAAALARGRAGEGPTLLELSPPPDASISTARLRTRLTELGDWSRAGEQRDREEAALRWDRAFAEAVERPRPRLESLTDQVFAGEEFHLSAQRNMLLGRDEPSTPQDL
jgi:TPP-dependent pyruvate/acetoin dehydrogenase alpha subunit